MFAEKNLQLQVNDLELKNADVYCGAKVFIRI
jgi:hypothetical protein